MGFPLVFIRSCFRCLYRTLLNNYPSLQDFSGVLKLEKYELRIKNEVKVVGMKKSIHIFVVMKIMGRRAYLEYIS